MKKIITLAVFALSLSAHIYFGYFTGHTMSASIDSQPAFDSSAEYDCQMLMAETTDWDQADIIEACQQ